MREPLSYPVRNRNTPSTGSKSSGGTPACRRDRHRPVSAGEGGPARLLGLEDVEDAVADTAADHLVAESYAKPDSSESKTAPVVVIGVTVEFAQLARSSVTSPTRVGAPRAMK